MPDDSRSDKPEKTLFKKFNDLDTKGKWEVSLLSLFWISGGLFFGACVIVALLQATGIRSPPSGEPPFDQPDAYESWLNR
jgi:hypothetical protein